MDYLSSVTELVRSFAPPHIEINPQSRLVEDLSIDSIGLIELVMRLEETYGIEVPDHDMKLATFETVEKISQYVNSVSAH